MIRKQQELYRISKTVHTFVDSHKYKNRILKSINGNIQNTIAITSAKTYIKHLIFKDGSTVRILMNISNPFAENRLD